MICAMKRENRLRMILLKQMFTLSCQMVRK